MSLTPIPCDLGRSAVLLALIILVTGCGPTEEQVDATRKMLDLCKPPIRMEVSVGTYSNSTTFLCELENDE